MMRKLLICLTDECLKKAFRRGYCESCYSKIRPYNIKCSLEDCNKPNVGLGFCNKHYQRFKRLGTPYISKREKGTGWIDGYHKIQKGPKTYRMHRLVWENNYGPIPEGYEVHHKDGDKLNNQIHNLELMSKGSHLSHHKTGMRHKDETKKRWSEIRKGVQLNKWGVTDGKCSLPECEKKYHGLGFCRKHWLAFKTHGDPNKTLRPRKKD